MWCYGLIFFLIAGGEAPGFFWFNESLDLDWFEKLGVERMSRRYQHGQLINFFKPVPGRRNEAIDCLAYNMAAMTVLSIKNWDLSEKFQIEARQNREKLDYFK